MKTLTQWVVVEEQTAKVPDRQIINELFEKKHWTYVDMGEGGMIYSPVTIGKFEYSGLDLSLKGIPRAAKRRVKAILKSDARPQGFLVAHELKRTNEDEIILPKVDWLKIAKIGVGIISTIAAAIASLVSLIALVAVVAAALPLMGVLILLGAVSMLDPKIVCVTAEGEWLEVFSYYS